MMRTRQAGFTLVELLLVAVLGAVILGAAYQSLILQERSYRITSNAVLDQDALRTVLGVLESELREVNTSGGAAGLPDIIAATEDSVVFRASRGLAFVCAVQPAAMRMHTWSLAPQDFVQEGDVALIFADGAPETSADDGWLIARASDVDPSTNACPPRVDGGTVADQQIQLATLPGGPNVDGNFLSNGVQIGAPVRSMQEVTYGLYEFDTGWGLGRRIGTGDVQELITGLDEPGAGLTFTYLDANGTVLSDPVADPTDIAAIEIAVSTLPRAGNEPIDLETSIFLRNN